MRTVHVELGSRSYDILIGSHLLNQLGELMRELGLGRKALLVTDTNVGPVYGARVMEILTRAGFQVAMVQVPAGEKAKSLEQAARLYDAAFDHELDRNCPVVALGGGVVGDLAGFVAATYMRGVPFIQVPTTLLAQVDSSVGGKVAVNHPRGKNIIGAFYQPKLVLIDTGTLDTLDRQNLKAGLAEVIKYGVIWDASFFCWLEENIHAALNKNIQVLDYIVEKCCSIKAAVVARDETEQGLRAILNYGHTIGHALESITDYRTYLHGEAVAIGMVYAARLAVAQGMLKESDCQRITGLVHTAGLPTTMPPELAINELIKLMYHDKKVSSGSLTLVLPTGIGSVKIIKGFPEAEIAKTLANLQG